MRVDEFLETMNASIEHYSHWIKIFIASIVVLIAYNYFFVPSVLLMSVGAIAYVYMKTTRIPPPFSNSNRDWSALNEAREPLLPPIELAAPAPEITATPTPTPAPESTPVDSKQT
jgi:hypothetical protein